jgi:hypothetical protein
MKCKPDPIRNDDTVVADIGDHSITYVFRDLKQLFIAKKLTVTIKSLYLKRTNTHWFVTYKPTGGFKFRRLNKEELK